MALMLQCNKFIRFDFKCYTQITFLSVPLLLFQTGFHFVIVWFVCLELYDPVKNDLLSTTPVVSLELATFRIPI